MPSSKTVLITGILGFTGRHLCEALRKRGNKVVGLAYQAVDQPDIYECDLRDEIKLTQLIAKLKPDYVIHLAAISFVAEADASSFYGVNVIGTCNLMKALEQVNVQKVIVASSANVYGNPADGLPISESLSPQPVNHYAASKLAMEHMVRTWQDKFPIVITRPFNYTGPGQAPHFLVPKIVSHFSSEKAIIELGNLDVSRDFTSISDLVRAYICILGSDIAGETVNICSGVAISLDQIVSWMRELAQHDIDVQINPDFVRSNEIKTLLGNNSHLKALTGWAPRQTMKDVLKLMLSES